MFLTIGNVLSAGALAKAQQTANALTWRDGAITAGAIAKQVKRNQQADLSTSLGKTLSSALLEAISGHEVLRAAARPARFSSLLLSRTPVGGGYGAHVDNALMGHGADRLRTDLSFTLFLSDQDSYKGGALALDLPGGVQSLKPRAGDLVLYPSTLIHEVEPVMAGERLAAVGWIQSEIRSDAHRQILFDLEQVRTALRGQSGKNSEKLLMDKAFANLLREWSDL